MPISGTLLYILVIIIILILIIVLLKFLFAVIFIAPYAYAQNTEAPVIDYGPADLFPGGPGWGFNDFLIQ